MRRLLSSLYSNNSIINYVYFILGSNLFSHNNPSVLGQEEYLKCLFIHVSHTNSLTTVLAVVCKLFS